MNKAKRVWAIALLLLGIGSLIAAIYINIQAASPNPEDLYEFYECTQCRDIEVTIKATGVKKRVYREKFSDFVSARDPEQFLISPSQVKETCDHKWTSFGWGAGGAGDF